MNGVDVLKGFSLNEDDKVLIVGGRYSNFPDYMRSNPRIVFWDSVDPTVKTKEKIPEGVRLILFLRFITHALQARIQSIAPSNMRIVTYVQSTRVVREILRMLKVVKVPESGPAAVITVGKTKEVSVVESAKKRMARGSLQKFVRENADFNASNVQEEVRRLQTVAALEGTTTSVSSLTQSYYKLRRDLKQQPSKRPTGVPALDSAKIGESEIHLREFIAKLREFRGSAELAEVVLEEIIHDRERLVMVEEELKKLKEAMKPFLDPRLSQKS